MGKRLLWSVYPALLYMGLGLLIMYPLFRYGQIFLLDWVAPTDIYRPNLFSPHPTVWFFYIFSSLAHLPTWLVEKMYFTTIIFVAGIGMHRLVPFSLPAKIFAGLLYACNPFIYGRFITGQVNIVIAYALFPFFVYALVQFLKGDSWRHGVYVALWAMVVLAASVHFIPLIALVTGALLLYFFIRDPITPPFLRRYVTLLAVLMVVIGVVVATRYSRVEKTVQDIVWTDFFEFAPTVPESGHFWSSTVTLFSLHGFWVERDARYILAKDVVPAWPLWQMLILGLVGVGLFQSVKQRSRYLVVPLFFIGCVSLILALGVAHPLTEAITKWLFYHVPFYSGLRDTQKWQALVALSTAYIGSYGVETVKKSLSDKREHVKKFSILRTGVITFFCCLPLIVMPLMFGGFGGQVQSSLYPPGWYAVRDIINQDESRHRVLFLPWHQYLPLSFADQRIVTNPAFIFFGNNTLAGDNLEKGNVYTTSQRPESRKIESQIVRRSGQDGTPASLFEELDIEYVILSLEHDFDRYWWLLQEETLETAYRDGSVILLRYRGQK